MRCEKWDCRHPLKINTKTINSKTQWLLVQGGEGHWSRKICNWHLLLQFESELSPNAWCVKGWSPGWYNWSEITGRDNWCLKRWDLVRTGPVIWEKPLERDLGWDIGTLDLPFSLPVSCPMWLWYILASWCAALDPSRWGQSVKIMTQNITLSLRNWSSQGFHITKSTIIYLPSTV